MNLFLFFPFSRQKDPGRRAGTCRVCLKSFKPEEFFKMCSECQQKVCEDCASYSKLDENQDEVSMFSPEKLFYARLDVYKAGRATVLQTLDSSHT